MCGRYYLADDINIAAFIERLKHRHDQQKLELFKTGEISPGQVAITYNSTGYELMRWNYRLFNRTLINTRIESIRDRDFYRSDYLNHKCLIIASGFYEWNSEKKKHYIRTSDRLMFLGAIYQHSDDLNSFSIITKPATSTSSIHDRIPLVLNRDQALEYLKGNLSIRQLIELQPDFSIEVTNQNMSLF
ncbi:MAG: SOS response-associated peptidase family protein [Erysipelotrichaceae bacterium]|nr:SOS response-associated peptidase family protein [Erysipelotrichaceae bacterium]